MTSELSTNTSAIFYLWGDRSYNFTLKATNIDGQLSAPASLSGRSRPLGKFVNKSISRISFLSTEIVVFKITLK